MLSRPMQLFISISCSQQPRGECPPCATLWSCDLKERTQCGQAFLLGGDIGVADYAFPYACILNKLAHDRVGLAGGETKLFGGGLVALLPDLPVLVDEAVGERERGEVLLGVGHGGVVRVGL